MKILFVSLNFHNNQRCWVKTLLDKGHEVDYLAWLEHALRNQEIVKAKIIERSIIHKVLFNFWSGNKKTTSLSLKLSLPKIFTLFKEMKYYDPDVVIIRNPHAYLFCFIAMLIARMTKRQILIYTQTPLYKKVNVLKKTCILFIMKIFKAKWITPVLGDKGKYSKFHKEAYFIPFVIELTGNYLKKEDEKDVLSIVSVGKLTQKRKNHLLLLKAFKKIVEKEKIHLTLIGSLGDEKDLEFKKLQNYIKNNDLLEKISLKKNMPYKEMYNEYMKNNFFVLPSSNEPASYSLLEAMSCGLPVICSDTNGTKWYIEEDKNGYVFKSDNLEDLTSKIFLIISNKSKMKEMGNKSRRLVEKKYSPEIFYEELMNALI